MLGLVTLRESFGLSQKELSNEVRSRKGGRFRVGQTKQVITRLETGRVALGYDHYEVYAKIFGIPAGAFFAATHVVSRKRENSPDLVRKYAQGLKQLAAVMDDIANEPPLPSGESGLELQKLLLIRLFDCWRANGLDTTELPPQRTHESSERAVAHEIFEKLPDE